MHVVITAPVNIPSFAPYLSTESANKAGRQPLGTGTAPTSLAIALIGAGHQVTVVTHSNGEPRMELTGPDLRIVQVASRHRARNRALDGWRVERRNMTEVIKESGADVVHAHWAYECAQAAIATELPVAITIRDAPLTVLRYTPTLYRAIRAMMAYRTRLTSKRACLAAPSPYLASKWRRQTLMKSTRVVEVIPNMVPAGFERRSARSEHPLIVEVADSSRTKNVKNLLFAFNLVKGAVPDAELRLIGPGLGQDGPLAGWAMKHQLESGVSFLGSAKRDVVERHLTEAWLHVHASKSETFGNTLVEAMTLGTAVMGGSKSGAVPWVVNDGKAGFLTDVTNVGGFADDMITCLSDLNLCESMATRGHDHVFSMFSSARVIDKTVALYEKTIGAH
ncbi:glycosyltransferase family 4 protein [Arthrobacter crystallopoietes]|uniref:glycosyltransferase family 4 protein n=1 Tax=Crystallibacter crystallopoietes TaxID=37928 RepID=UPI0011114DFB|nr:glycosyltransferase family 4 protein [Arthrobacter crystallopoietes]